MPLLRGIGGSRLQDSRTAFLHRSSSVPARAGDSTGLHHVSAGEPRPERRRRNRDLVNGADAAAAWAPLAGALTDASAIAVMPVASP
jgi:hypothetical protein